MTVVRNRSGFTLVEIVVATIIGSFIAVVAVGSLQTITKARHTVEESIAITDELRFAANMIRRDLANIYRDRNPKAVKFEGSVEGPEGVPLTSMTLRVVSPVKARPEAKEGDVYEVQYFVKADDERSMLMRRYCPIVGHEEKEMRQGGMLSVIAEHVLDMKVLYYDDNEWLDVWPEEMERHPSLVQVTLVGGEKPSEDEELLDENELEKKTFIVGFPRTGQEKEVTDDSEEGEDEPDSDDES